MAMVDLPQGRCKHFSFILMKRKIVSFGWNQIHKTDPFAAKHGYEYPYVHSELHALKNFPYPPAVLSKCKLINVRVNKQGRVLMSKPCEDCETWVIPMDFKEIWYTSEGAFVKL